MSSGEDFPGPGSESTERLVAIEKFWLEDAAALLVTVPGGHERDIAQRTYVVDLLARLQWEQEQSVEYGRAETSRRLNQLFHEGLSRAAEARDTEVTARMHLDYRGWYGYLRRKVYSAVETVDNELPTTFLDLAVWLRQGKAWFREQT